MRGLATELIDDGAQFIVRHTELSVQRYVHRVETTERPM
jgi:hypothetical protein